jgi:hypothetical protein
MTFTKGVKKGHCKISISKLVLRSLLFCHSGFDLACPALDPGESSLSISGFLLEFIPMEIEARMTPYQMNEFNLKY